jgi:hypothetical protein
MWIYTSTPHAPLWHSEAQGQTVALGPKYVMSVVVVANNNNSSFFF